MSTIFNGLLVIGFCCILANNAQAVDTGKKKVPEAIKVGITTHLGDHQVFTQGDEIRFLLTLEQAAWVYLYYQDSENHVVQLIPNSQQASNYFQPGWYLPLSPKTPANRFVAEPPFGVDEIWVFALDKPAPVLPGTWLESGLKLMRQPMEQIRSAMKKQASQRFGSSSLQISTQPAR